MGSVDLSRLMHTLATNFVDGPAVLIGQMHFCLAHGYTPLRRMALLRVYSCFVFFVLQY